MRTSAEGNTQSWQALIEGGKRQFLSAVLPLLKSKVSGKDAHFLVNLLSANGLLFPLLSDPGEFRLEDAVEVARRGIEQDASIVTKLTQYLSNGQMSDDAQQRLLDVLVEVATKERLPLILSQMTRHSNPRIRARATLLSGKYHRTALWMRQHLTESDPRVRANAIEAMWGLDDPDCRRMLLEAVSDPIPRIRVNALVGLYLVGDTSSVDRLLRLGAQGAMEMRRSAAWAMGYLRDPRFLPVLTILLKDQEESIARNAQRAIDAIQERMRTLESAAALDLRILSVNLLSDRTHRVGLTVRNRSTGHLVSVPPLHFLVREGEDQILDYWVEQAPQEESLAMALAIEQDLMPGLSGVLEQALAGARPAETWIVSGFQTSSLPAPAGHRPLGTLPGQDAGLLAIVQTLIRLLASFHNASRTLVILSQSAQIDLEQFQMDHVVAAALADGVKVHVVAPEQLRGRLEPLAKRSEGSFHAIDEASQAQDIVRRLYSSLHAQYRLCYRSEPGRAGKHPLVRLEVLSENGRGEVAVELP